MPTTLRGGWLGFARAMWLLVAVLALGLFVASIPPHFAQLRTVCTGTTCGDAQPTPAGVQSLRGLGLSIGFYAVYFLTLEIVFALVFFAIAIAIFWRKSNERLVFLVALMLVTVGAIFPEVTSVLTERRAAWNVVVRLLKSLSIVSFTIFCYLFPDGRFVPRWTRIAAVFMVAWQVPEIFFPTSHLSMRNRTPLLDFLFYASWFSTMVFAQIYRYRYVSSPRQRQQTKWVVFGMTAALVGFLLAAIVLPVISPLNQPGSLYFLLVNTATYLSVLLIPLSLAVAILYSRLWDIDVLINHALVYGVLTAVLGLTYYGSVVLLQHLFRVLTGLERQGLVTVTATLTLAALFTPLRRRIQDFIDRRFYRRTYNAARTLQAFSATLSHEVDLDKLSADLVAVVEATMQPSHVSLWLRPPNHQKGQDRGDSTVGENARMVEQPRTGLKAGHSDKRLGGSL